MKIAEGTNPLRNPKAWAVALATLLASALATAETTLNVSSVSQLQDAISVANSNGGNYRILLADGIYRLQSTLYVNAPGISIAGASGDRNKVTIEGDVMSSSSSVGNLIRVGARDFTLENVTLQKSGFHLIQIAGENDADNATIRNCILRDAYEQMLKVSIDQSNLAVSADNGRVENCIFEYTAGVGPQFYIGGIDAHGAKNWNVSGNRFRGISSPDTSVAEFAVHFWNSSSNNTVEGNLIIDCDRGIGFGLGDRGNSGGTIRNNIIVRRSSGAGSFADVGIALENSVGTEVYNNTIFLQDSFPWSIEYRFAGTKSVSISNNLSNRPIISRDGGQATLASNIGNAVSNWFVSVSNADLHLAGAIAEVIDKGIAVAGLTEDFDGDVRPAGSGIDIGADEYGNVVRPKAPTNVQVN